jgi:peptidyl-prolyl cis-trans isomerase B (cyclophilin B)
VESSETPRFHGNRRLAYLETEGDNPQTMTPRIFSALALAALVAVGAGCSSKTDTSVMPYATDTDSYSNTNEAPPAETVTPTATTTPDSSSSTSMTDEKLAYPGILPESETANKIVRVNTTKGEIVFELLPKEGPMSASNFVYLTNKKFYDGTAFHRVESWVIQGGDPAGTGMGGPGYTFGEDKVNLPYERGIVAMAKTMMPNSSGSQFFIMKNEVPLDPDYSIFGRVLSGMEVVDKIVPGDKMTSVTVEDAK